MKCDFRDQFYDTNGMFWFLCDDIKLSVCHACVFCFGKIKPFSSLLIRTKQRYTSLVAG